MYLSYFVVIFNYIFFYIYIHISIQFFQSCFSSLLVGDGGVRPCYRLLLRVISLLILLLIYKKIVLTGSILVEDCFCGVGGGVVNLVPIVSIVVTRVG